MTLEKNIPSYLYVRGWKAFVKYNGQQQTCRKCKKTGHIARDCPEGPKNKRSASEDDPRPGTSNSKDVPVPPAANSSRKTDGNLMSIDNYEPEDPKEDGPTEEQLTSMPILQETYKDFMDSESKDKFANVSQ